MEMLHKLNQLEVIPSDELLQLTETLCEQSEKVRRAISDYFEAEEDV